MHVSLLCLTFPNPILFCVLDSLSFPICTLNPVSPCLPVPVLSVPISVLFLSQHHLLPSLCSCASQALDKFLHHDPFCTVCVPPSSPLIYPSLGYPALLPDPQDMAPISLCFPVIFQLITHNLTFFLTSVPSSGLPKHSHAPWLGLAHLCQCASFPSTLRHKILLFHVDWLLKEPGGEKGCASTQLQAAAWSAQATSAETLTAKPCQITAEHLWAAAYIWVLTFGWIFAEISGGISMPTNAPQVSKLHIHGQPQGNARRLQRQDWQKIFALIKKKIHPQPWSNYFD